MSALPWFWIWLIAAALLYVAEMMTTTFFILPFAFGATIAFFAQLLGADPWLQWALFVIVSVLCLVFVRPIFKRLTSKAEPEQAGVDRLIGTTGVIIEGTSPSGSNRARVAGEIWNVATENGMYLMVGTMVRVLRVDGVYLVVEMA